MLRRLVRTLGIDYRYNNIVVLCRILCVGFEWIGVSEIVYRLALPLELLFLDGDAFYRKDGAMLE